jgi:S-adenosylhomocysteine hydrolase
MQKLPLIELAASLIEDDMLNDCYVIGVQHILPTTLTMFESLFKKGLRPENVSLIGKCYSTDCEIYEKMLQKGFDVCENSKHFDSHKPFDQAFKENIRKFLLQRVSRLNSSKFKKVIIVDDGGEFLEIIDEFVTDFDRLIGIEQTSSGFNRLAHKDHKMTIVNLARASSKLFHEPPKIINMSLERIEQYIHESKKEIKKVLIIGKGAIGTVLYDHLKNIYEVSVFDVVPEKSDFPAGDLNHRLSEFDLIIGCTGNESLKGEQHKFLKKGCVLASVSSSDREFDAVALRKKVGKIDSCFDHLDVDGITLLNCGFPISFRGENVDDPEFFQFVRALIISSIRQTMETSHQLGFVDLKQHLQDLIVQEFTKIQSKKLIQPVNEELIYEKIH